jgi:hypothetical protein
VAGFLLACLMAIMAVLVAADLAARLRGVPNSEPILYSLIVPFTDAFNFAVLIGFAYPLRKNGPAHKRLIANGALQQPTPPNDPQRSLRRFLKFGQGSGGGHLLRILGVRFGLAVGVGNTVGAGILHISSALFRSRCDIRTGAVSGLPNAGHPAVRIVGKSAAWRSRLSA